MRVLTLPNAITFVRILIIPVFVMALLYKRYNYALMLFIAAGASDLLDGLLARTTNQKTELGAFLDPLADKILLVTSFILFSVYSWIPTWLTIIVISRDVIVILGWVVFYLLYGVTQVKPSLFGKAAITSQLILIAYTLLSINIMSVPAPADWMLWCVAMLTVVSCIHYSYRGLSRENERQKGN
jgi:cardiolipin synthase